MTDHKLQLNVSPGAWETFQTWGTGEGVGPYTESMSVLGLSG